MVHRGMDPAVVAAGAQVDLDHNRVVPTEVEDTQTLGVGRGSQLRAVVAGSLVAVDNGEGTVVVARVGGRGTVVVV